MLMFLWSEPNPFCRAIPALRPCRMLSLGRLTGRALPTAPVGPSHFQHFTWNLIFLPLSCLLPNNQGDQPALTAAFRQRFTLQGWRKEAGSAAAPLPLRAPRAVQGAHLHTSSHSFAFASTHRYIQISHPIRSSHFHQKKNKPKEFSQWNPMRNYTDYFPFHFQAENEFKSRIFSKVLSCKSSSCFVFWRLLLLSISVGSGLDTTEPRVSSTVSIKHELELGQKKHTGRSSSSRQRDLAYRKLASNVYVLMKHSKKA